MKIFFDEEHKRGTKDQKAETGMIEINAKKLFPLQMLATTFVVFACFVFLRELSSMYYPIVAGGPGPIEYKFSRTRVFLFCGSAIISALFAWSLTTREHLSVFLPDIKPVIFIAVGITLISMMFNYDANLVGPEIPVRFFGFPFSYLGCSLYDGYQPIINYAPEYHFHFFRFFLDILFWSNTVFIIPSWVLMLIKKEDVNDKQQAK